MSIIYTPEYLEKHLQVPDDIIPFVLATPRLLPGEKEDDYLRLFEMMATEILPDPDIEWLWTIDITWLWFEIQRYRRWKNAIIMTRRADALEDALSKTNPLALQVGGMNSMIRAESRLESQQLRLNPSDQDLNARLHGHGYDLDAINATAFVHAAASLTLVDKFLTSARQQATAILREVKSHRGILQACWRCCSPSFFCRKKQPGRGAQSEKAPRDNRGEITRMASDRQLAANGAMPA